MLIYLLIIAAVAYGVFFVLDRRAVGGDSETPSGSGPVGPDDDEEFLRTLDRRTDDDR